MNKNRFLYGIAVSVLLFAIACKKTNTLQTTVFVSTSNMQNVTSISATGGGDVDLVGTKSISERGICWSSDSTSGPTIENNKVVAVGNDTGHFTAQITGLASGIVYFARAYVINEGKPYYGNEIKFTASLPIELISNGDFTLPNDNVKYLNLNDIPDWKTDDTTTDGLFTGREYDPWRHSACAYIVDWASFYQIVADVPTAKSVYNIKFDANYIYTDWGGYEPKFYIIFSTFTDNPSERTPIDSVVVPSGTFPTSWNNNWKSYEASFTMPANSPYAGKKLIIEWAMENYKTESWGWSNTYFDFDNISVIRTLE